MMALILWLGALALIGAGIFALLRGAVFYGVVLVAVGLLLGPGGINAIM